MRLVCGMACISVPLARKRAAAPFPGAPTKQPDGQNAPRPCFFPRHAMIRRANSEAPLPAGQTASNTPTGSAPCPPGQGSVAQRAAGGRPLLVGLPPSAPTAAPSEPKRSAPAPCSWGGRASPWGRRRWLPALPAGPSGLRAFGRVTLCPTRAKRAAPALKMLGRLLFFPYISFLMSCMPFLFAVSILRASHFSLFRVYRRKEVSGLDGSTAGA